MAAYTVSVNDGSIELPVNVTVFGSLSHNATVILQHGEDRSSFSIGRSSGIQNLLIPGSADENKIITVTVTLTTEDPLVELKGNVTTAVSMVASNGLLYS